MTNSHLWDLFLQEHLLQGKQGPVLLPLLIAGSEHGQERQAQEGSSFTPTAQMNCRGIK